MAILTVAYFVAKYATVKYVHKHMHLCKYATVEYGHKHMHLCKYATVEYGHKHMHLCKYATVEYSYKFDIWQLCASTATVGSTTIDLMYCSWIWCFLS